MSKLLRFCCVLLLSACAFTLRAQEVTASITGLLTDPTGAAVPGARVVATHVTTNASRTVESGPTGEYVIPLLQPGTYKLVVSHPGFKSYTRDGIVLQINQRARIDVGMSIGTIDEKVEVFAEVPTINTENATHGKVIDNKSIALMPLNGRLNIVGLLAMAPGIQNAGTQDSIPAYGITPTVSGAPSVGATNWTIDGTRNVPPNIARGLGDWPPLDGIQEFKVITSGASAEFDQANQVIVVTRGGANEFHGTGLWFNRNRVLAAKNFFATHLPKPQYNRNEFGGNFSGPVLLPNLYNGRNRTFFFFNYEGFRRRQAVTSTASVATAAMRQGDFSGLSTITDPLSGTAFPGNRIPSDRLSTVTRQLGALYPLPNLPGTGPAGTGVNLTENIPLREHVNRWSFRVDQNISDRDQIHAALMYSNLGPNQSIGPVSTFGGLKQLGDHDRNLSVAWNHMINSRMINEFRVGYLGVGIFRVPQNVDIDFASIIPGLGFQAISGAPQLSITNITSMGEAGGRDRDNVGSMGDNFSVVRGSHTLKTGFNFIWGHQANLNENVPYRGAYNFTGKYAGIAYADFVLGYPVTTQRPLPGWKTTGNRDIRSGFYFQDDWRLTRALTLNFGVRYDFVPEQQETHGQASMFVPKLARMVVFGNHYPEITNQRLVTQLGIPLSKDVSLPSNVMDYIGNDCNNIAPRVGFAWRVRPSTVVRSGFGLYYVALAGGLVSGLSSVPPFVSNETFEQPAGTVPGFTMYNPFPGSGTLPANPSSQYQPKFVTPYSAQWNLTVERQVGRDTGLRVGYYGQRNIKLLGSFDLNNVGPAPGPTQPRRPFQPFSAITQANNAMYQSTSNQLQGGIQKRYSSGLMVNAEYQYARVIGTETYMNFLNFNDSRGSIAGIRKHVLVLSYVYDLPVGKNQLLLSEASGVLQGLVGGWQLAGITTALSGAPFSPSFSTSVQGSVGGRPDVVRGVALYPAQRTLTNYFNAAAFTKPPDFTFGNAGYSLLWGRGLQTWDASLVKTINLRERARLEVKLEAFSVFNHPVFGQPAANISNASTVGRITSASAERTVQLGAKLTF